MNFELTINPVQSALQAIYATYRATGRRPTRLLCSPLAYRQLNQVADVYLERELDTEQGVVVKFNGCTLVIDASVTDYEALT